MKQVVQERLNKFYESIAMHFDPFRLVSWQFYYISPQNAIRVQEFEYLTRIINVYVYSYSHQHLVVKTLCDFFQFDPCGSIFLHVDDKEYDNRAKTVPAGMIAKNKGHTFSRKRASNSFSIKTTTPFYLCIRLHKPIDHHAI